MEAIQSKIKRASQSIKQATAKMDKTVTIKALISIIKSLTNTLGFFALRF
jgi:flagellin-specific chaperone FliS